MQNGINHKGQVKEGTSVYGKPQDETWRTWLALILRK